MKNNTEVRIMVRGVHRDEDGKESVTEFAGCAEYYERGGSRYLVYEEADAESGSTKNILKWRKSQMEPDGETGTVLELTKRGAVNARMVFEPGQTHKTEYATPCGRLQLGIQTDEVSCLEETDAVKLRAKYALTAQDEVFDRCLIVVRAAR